MAREGMATPRKGSCYLARNGQRVKGSAYFSARLNVIEPLTAMRTSVRINETRKRTLQRLPIKEDRFGALKCTGYVRTLNIHFRALKYPLPISLLLLYSLRLVLPFNILHINSRRGVVAEHAVLGDERRDRRVAMHGEQRVVADA
jgi:hypothetical protein